MKIGIAFGMVAKAAMVGGTILRDTAQTVAEAALKRSAFSGWWSKGAGEAVGDPARGVDPAAICAFLGFPFFDGPDREARR